METTINFAKIRPDAIIPSKRDEDMGYDIYSCFDEDFISINPNETKMIPTGIASACDPEYGFLLRERGSTGSKGIALRAGVIDSGYRNEWFVCLTNTTNKVLFISKLSAEEIINYLSNNYNINYKPYNIIVYPYKKAIAQAIVIPMPKTIVNEISYESLQNIRSDRGSGALGSSGK